MKLDYAERVIASVERNAILRIQGSYIGGIERFSDLCIQRLDLLIKGGYADPLDRRNQAPSTGEFRAFLAKNPRFTAHGYVVSPHRREYRTVIRGVKLLGSISEQETEAFVKMFRYAEYSEATADQLFCWYQ